MKNIHSFPNNVDEFVGAKPMMRWFHGRTSGVWAADKNAAVTPAADNSMQVAVSDGLGWLSDDEGDGIVWWNNTAKDTGSPMVLDVEPADTILNRIDRVVVTWETYGYSKLPNISILKGKSAVDAKPPELTNDNTKRQISFAQISIPAGTLKIVPSLITDERLNPDVCGIVTESMKIDTSVIQAQFMEYLDKIETILTQVLDKVIPDNTINTNKLTKGAVTTEKLADSSVSEAKLQDSAVTENKIHEGAVSTSKIAKSAVTNEKLYPLSVTEDKIKENSVTENLTANISAGSWVNKGIYFEATANVPDLDPKYPFIIDLNLDSSTYAIADDLQNGFGLIFDAKCEAGGKLTLRAKEKLLKNIPVKIIKIKR